MERTLEAMEVAKLDALLLFKPESHYWLTGYDTFGYCFFQCLVLRADGRMALLTRSADRRQAALTSLVEDVRIWRDRHGAEPVRDLQRLLAELGLEGRRYGVEWDTAGLTAASGLALAAVLDGRATLVDASLLISHLRVVKSTAELAYCRQAAMLADEALAAALAVAAPGADEAAVRAALLHAINVRDGDDMGNPVIIGSGPYALLCRNHTGRRRLDTRDQLTMEWAGVYRHYHVAQMRTICIGEPTPRHRALFDAAVAALGACEAALRAGRTLGEVYDAHGRTLDALGLSAHRLNACGYSLGAVFAPSWMDWPMCYEGQPAVLEPDMVIFLHMILMDSDTGTAMTLGRTSRVTEGAAEPLTERALELLVR